jgi:Kef-type K+ transport system membrane component KefB
MVQLTFLVMFLSLIALVAIVPQLVKRWHVPTVVAVMAIGIIIGPGALNYLDHMNTFLGHAVETSALYNIVHALGFLGLVFLMALAGMEVDFAMLKNEKRAVSLLSCLTFAIPAAAGYFVYAWFEPGDRIGAWVYASLFASHSIGIVFPVIRELGIVKTRFGVAVLSSTVITDIASLMLLAICVQYKRMETPFSEKAGRLNSFSIVDHVDLSFLGDWFGPVFFLVILLYVLLVLLGLPFVWRLISKLLPEGDDVNVTYFLLTVLVVILLGELLGINLIVGAFVGGLAVGRTQGFEDSGKALMHKLESVGFGLVIPFLFLSIGFQANVGILMESWTNLSIALATVVGLVLSKVASGWLAMRLAGFSHAKGLCAGLMTVPQLSATLAAAAVALNLKMITEDFFNAIVVLSLMTTLPVPTLVRLVIKRWKIGFHSIDEVWDQPPGTTAGVPEQEAPGQEYTDISM